MYNAGITGIDFEVGENVVDNKYFENYLDTTDEWIRKKIGIKERRYVHKNEAFTDLALKAAKKAIRKADIKVEDIDLIIASTITPDHTNVASACLLQNLLGASKAAAFDLSNGGCPGSVYSLVTAAQFIEAGTYNTVLVVSGEIFSKTVNMEDRSICVYFGDGVGAAIVQNVCDGSGFISYKLGADGSGYYALAAEAGGSRKPIDEEAIKNKLHYAKMNGKAIWAFATQVFKKVIEESLEKVDLSIQDLDFVISHQANFNIIKYGMDDLGLPLEKTYINIDKYGNTGGASVFIALTEAVEKNLIKKNDTIALVAFGGGLAYGAVVLKW